MEIEITDPQHNTIQANNTHTLETEIEIYEKRNEAKKPEQKQKEKSEAAYSTQLG